jgi:hypothetical protein
MSRISKTIRLSGGSPDSIEDAIATVLARAALTITDIVRFEVVSIAGSVDAAGAPAHYEVTLDVTFGVKESVHG